MKVLVTGGCGFIGSNLVRLLIDEKGESVSNLDKLTYAGSLQALEDFKGHRDYRFEQVDLCDAQAVKDAFSRHTPDAVIHLAAESHVDRSIDTPECFIQSNIIGTYNLLQAALEYWNRSNQPETFRLLHVSTDEVYGSLELGGEAFSERTQYDPHSPYSASKAASDHLVRAWYHTYGLPVIVTNCSNTYGPYQFPEKLIPLVILKCLHNEEIPVYGKGENIRDWLYVKDHVEALYCVIRKGKIGDTYTIGGGNEQRNIDLVHKLCNIMDAFVPREQATQRYESLIRFVKDRPAHDARYAINSNKISTELNWAPKESISSGLEKTVRWYLENKNWWNPILRDRYHLERLGMR